MTGLKSKKAMHGNIAFLMVALIFTLFLLADKIKNNLKNQAHTKKCLAEAVRFELPLVIRKFHTNQLVITKALLP